MDGRITPATVAPARRVVLILALLASFGPLATDMYLSAFPDMQAGLHTDAAGIAATLSVFLLGLALGQLLYGPLSDRFGRRRPLLAGTALFCLASAGTLVSHDLHSFLVLRVLQAVGGCCGIIVGRAIVRDLYAGADIARAFSLLSMIGMAAPLVAPSLGAGIIQMGGWRAIFAVLVAFGAASFAAIWFGLPETLPPARRRTSLAPLSVLRVFARLLAQPRFIFAALTTGSAAGMLFSFITGSSLAFMGHYGVGRPVFAALFSAVVLAMIAGGQLNRVALRRHPSQVILRWTLTANLVASGVLVASAAVGITALFPALLIVVACVGSILPNSAAAAIAAGGDHAGSASSMLGVLQFGSGFLASSIVALAQDGGPYPMVVTIFACATSARTLWWAHDRHAPAGAGSP